MDKPQSLPRKQPLKWRLVGRLLPLVAMASPPLAAQTIAADEIAQETAPAEPAPVAGTAGGAGRLVAATPPESPPGIATFGPFRVLDSENAVLAGATDAASPGRFAAMLRRYPEISTIALINCAGTYDDRANLRLGLMLHARGIATYVPAGGLVRSGAVDLFLAGAHRYAEPTAWFAVHAWKDVTGRQPGDYAPDAPKNQAYLDYYRAVGFTESQARAFYAMTNSVPFTRAKWLTQAEMARWVRLDAMPSAAAARLTRSTPSSNGASQ
ncbi:alpha/beta hydrolase [Novosphingobium sp. G106]|uniref:alpha/beta hydrolase n=1 Tax=Novosphingobium sp. G106 TaxID=2849500 RepID=UPI001C2DBC1A|nr:alpha/beta hydrolase [Novosphingobium sp. G106]MBV1690872.1 alpha/beta hydrolase [Novosphingobium sp. G106]